MLLEVGPGDAVFVPSFTFVATAEVVALLKATPFFVDVKNDSFNMDIESLKDALVYSKKLGLKPKAIIPVDLFGQPANYPGINKYSKLNFVKFELLAARNCFFGHYFDNMSSVFS